MANYPSYYFRFRVRWLQLHGNTAEDSSLNRQINKELQKVKPKTNKGVVPNQLSAEGSGWFSQ
jgi:hypothetical protein